MCVLFAVADMQRTTSACVCVVCFPGGFPHRMNSGKWKRNCTGRGAAELPSEHRRSKLVRVRQADDIAVDVHRPIALMTDAKNPSGGLWN